MFAGYEMIGHGEHGQRFDTFEGSDCVQRGTFHLDTQDTVRGVVILSVVVGFLEHVAGENLAGHEGHIVGLGRCRGSR